jgi:hypothetical protein
MALHKLVSHCYRNTDAFAVIVTLTQSSGQGGGVWDDLTNENDFHEGPLKDSPAGVLRMWKEGIGLEYGEPYEMAKNKVIDIRTHDGGVSRIMLKSIPIASQIVDRIKGPAFSFILMEEITNTHHRDYFIKLIQQLGRRRTVPASEQQYVATCNPADDGRDHWVYKKFFLPKKSETLKDHAKRFGVHHIKMSENEWMEDKDGYIENVLEECEYDPTAYDRLVLGKWEKRILGSGMFEGYWVPEIHIKGKRGEGLVPFKDEMFTVGYDPGNVNNSRVFMQRSNVDGRWIWRVIDEVINTKQRLTDHQLVLPILDKMEFWNRRQDCLFPYEHIADEAVFNQFSPSSDTGFVYREWAKISHEFINEIPRYAQLNPIMMKGPKKGAGSIEARVKTVINKLATEQILVSGNCPMVIEMFSFLKRARDKHGNDEMFKALRTKHIHIFDALSYPIYYYDLLYGTNRPQSVDEEDEPEVITFK